MPNAIVVDVATNTSSIVEAALPQSNAQDIIDQAQIALNQSDITILRCFEAGVAAPPEWVAYRKALRAVRSSGVGPLPAMPDYPAGT